MCLKPPICIDTQQQNTIAKVFGQNGGAAAIPVAAAANAAPLAEVQVVAKSSSGGGGAAAAPSPSPSQQQQPAGRGATFRAQAGALYRKNAVYQRRNWRTNACLLSAPVFFCLLLFGIQIAINKLLLTGDDYACGCRCTRCCFEGDANNCTAVSFGTCAYECLETSKTECGIQYSSARQAFFCAVPRPSTWPAVMQVPAAADRAQPWRPDPVLLYTGRDRATADKLAGNLLAKPAATPASLLGVQRYLSAWNASEGGSPSTIPGEVLSKMGLTLGTSARIFAGLYVETALARDEELYALWPEGTCKKLGLDGAVNVSLADMTAAMVNASNPPGVARTLNAQLRSLLRGGGGGGADAEESAAASDGIAAGVGGGQDALALVTQLRLNCTDVPVAFVEGAAALSRWLYCGYYQARCNGGASGNGTARGAQQLTAAYDWKGTDEGR